MANDRRRKAGKATKGPRVSNHLIALEPRMMFDGAAVTTALATTDVLPAHDGFDLNQDPFAHNSSPALDPQIQAFTDTGYDIQFDGNDDRTNVRVWRTTEALAWLPVTFNTYAPNDNGDQSNTSTLSELISEWQAESGLEETGPPVHADTGNVFIFVDTNVTGYDLLIQEWQGRGTIVLIDGNSDGVDQILSALNGQENVEAIHIVSHGEIGSFRLGSSTITADLIASDTSGRFAAIGAHLSAQGDLLIYGCDTGQGEAGQALLNALAQATDADVAASLDDTGYVMRGGNWALENRLGVIDATSLTAERWEGLLAPAIISVSSTTSVLRVYNSAGTLVSDSAAGTGWTGGRSVGVSAGGYAVWSNAGTVGGQAVDLRAVIVSSTTGTTNPDVINFDRPTTTSNDPAFLLTAAAGTGTASIQVRWELVLAGTNTPIAADINYTIADLDGTGANVNAPTRESVIVSTDTLSSFQNAGTSNIRFITSTPGSITAYGTVSETAIPPQPISAARFNWLNTSNWTITYQTVRSAALTAGFSHDGNSEFNLGTGGVTTSIPRTDLDSNNSTASGSNYLTTFTENGTAVRIVDTDVTLTNPVGTISSTTVTLTNAQAGDQLLVNGSAVASGTLAGGISYTISGNVVSLTGPATAVSYQNALQAITFQNTSERPNTVDRNITVGFSNGTFSSNNAVSTIRVIDINDTPTIVAPASYTGTEDTAVTINGITLGDPDSSTESVQLTVSVPAGVGTLNFATTAFITVLNNGTGSLTIQGQRGAIQSAVNNGALTLTPASNFNGTSTVSFVFNDRGNTGRDPGLTGDATSEEARATATVTIGAVNDAPTAVGNLPPQAHVDAATGISVQTASGFADVDGPSASYSATGLPAGLSINSATGEITGTINRSASQGGTGGVYTVVVTRSDGSLSATQSFSWTVTNPAPVATNDATLTINEDTAGTTVNVLANDSDPDGDPLSITSATATNGTVVVNANGTLTFTPNANYNGAATITYTISDGQGGTATATVPVTVVSVNDGPTRVGSLPPQTNVDAASGINVATAGAFADVDGPTATYSATGLPAGLTINSSTGAITGTIDRSASQVGGGVYNVVVTRSDGSLSVTQPFTWTVTNPAPIAANDTASTNEDTPIPSINVRANDSDPDGDPFTITAASAPNGTVTINGDGTLRYVPNANFNGTDTITYTISDGQGGTSTATVTVTVAAVNDAPTAVGSLPPQTHVDAASGISVPTAQGFADVDGPSATYSATGLPTGLSINSSTGVISGTIDRSASQGGTTGVYNVVVTRSDGTLSATQAFSWTITNPVPVAANDTATTAEDTPVTVNVLTNDSDPDGDPLTVIAASASVGTASIVGNQVRYTPPANYNGTATISYTISDGQGGTATATLTVTVTAVNDAPVATPIAPRSTTDGATLSIPVASNFLDVDGNTLSFTAAGLPPGLSIDPSTGVVGGMLTPNASQTGSGVYTATITASDGQGGTVTQTITINVTNPAPIAVNDSGSTPEDTPVTLSPLANDSDPDGDPLTITSAQAQNGSVVINADGTVTYTPNPGYNGTDTITYEISDGQGGTSTASITVAVADVNDTPTTSGTIANQTNLDAQVISLPVAGAFSDPDGDTLSYTATGLPAGLTIDPNTGIISGTIDNSASQVNGGAYTITVTASDGRGGTVSQNFTWAVSNPTPTANNDTATTNEDTPVNITVLANDVDPDGDPLTVTSASAGNGTVTINANGSLVYTPNPNFNGEDTIIYRITDSEGGVSTATVTVTVSPVNDAPTTVGLPNQNGDDGTSVSIPTASAFSDPDGNPLTFTATGLPPVLTIDPVTGVISGTLAPESSQNGPYVVTVTATDPSGAQVTATFVYAVQNIPPVATNDTATTPEDVPVNVAVLTNDLDPDGDPLTITSASANNGTVAINPDGSLTFTPAPNFNGVATVSYTISDGNGGIATATLTVTVGAVNDAPTADPIPNLANLDSESASVNVGSFFQDLDGDTLTFAAAGLPPGIGIDPATGILSGTLSANASQGAPYTVSITASDGNGGTVTQSFTWSVTNPAPTAVNDTATTNEDTAVAIPVLANDTDPDGDPLTVTQATALNGTIAISAAGVLTYTPNPNFNGEDTITYVISDSNGGQSTATVRVTVNPVNDVPVAVNDNATTNEDTPVTLNPLGNDTDVDGDPLTITAATSPQGTVVVNPDGTITFTPNQDFNGPATITYTISDGNGGTSTATITVQVDAVNDAPVANPSTAATNEDTPVTVPVLANDTDVDGDPLTVTAASAPNGTVVINPDGTVTYTPNPNFNGTDTITYTISDGQGGFSTSTVTVTVAPINDAPTATPIAPQSNDDTDVVNLPVAGNFADLDGNTLSFTATGLPAGLSIDPATGVISGTIDRSASQPAGGVYAVTVTASDGNGGTVTNTFTWTVANPGPTATNDSATTNEDTPVTIPVLANDNDPDSDPLTVTSATAPNGTVVINLDGTITYTPNANFNGSDTITYTISDGQGGTSTATVTVTVNAVNDAPVVDTPVPNVAGVDGASANIPTAGNFSDLDGNPLSFAATGLPAGLSIDPATGVISGTIDRNASQPNNGLYTVTVTASDGNGGTVSSTFTYTVTNPVPTATNDNATTTEDTAVTVNVLANDSDPDGDPLTVTSATSPDGTVTINANGSLTFTPAANFNGPTTISYAISDGNGGTTTATVTVNVTPVNDAPTVTPITPQNNADNDAIALPVAANFNDLDGNTLSFSASGLPVGLTIDPATGLISGTIDRNASQPSGGIYTVTVTASDGNGGTVSTTFTWTVTNPAPTAINDSTSTNEDTPVTVPVLIGDTDPDGDPLTITSATAPNGTVVINVDGTMTYTPSANFNGIDTITYVISDGNGGTSTASVEVTVAAVNDAPTVGAALVNRSNLDADTVSVDAAPNFSDRDGDPLNFSATGLPAGLSIDPVTGIISGIIEPAASQLNGGVYTVTVTATDSDGATVSSTFIWTITNPGPVAEDDISSTNEDTPVTIPVLLNDTDPDSDTLTVTAASAVNGTVTINPDGTIEYRPNPNFNGTDTVTYTISDGNGGTTSATVAVTVNPVNDAPTTLALPNLFDSNSETVSVPVGPAFIDLDGDTLTFAATGLPAGLSIDPATGLVSGTVSPTASAGGPTNNGVYTVTVTASDGNGGTVSSTFTWTISNTPPLAVDDSYTTNEDTPITLTVLANDTDPDGNPATPIQIVSATATNGTATVNPDGTINFVPIPDFNGTATVTYTISDGLGGFSTAIATIVIAPINDAPDANPLPNRENLDGAVISAQVGGLFTDREGDTLTYSATNLPLGLSINPTTGEISGTIDSNASQVNGGLYQVTITANDNNGGVSTSTFFWSIANPGPTANNDFASTGEDLPALSIPVLTNDNDPDDDTLTVTSASSPNGSVIIGANGVLFYTPNANFNGTDTITYTISDGQGGTATATVTVTVISQNDAPTVSPLPARSNADNDSINQLSVATNFTDIDPDALTFTATGLPLGLTMDAAGNISGTIDPSASQGAPNGIYTVTITADDGNGGTVSTSFNWTITNPLPVAQNESETTNEDTPVTIAVLTNDSDPDTDPLTITAVTSPDGTVVINPDGTLTFTPNTNFNGSTSISYTISDGNGGTATATVNVDVVPVNDPPTAAPIAPRSNVDSATVSVPVASNFTDLDGNTLSFTASGLPNGLSMDPTTGVISGTIAANASQPNGGVYTVTVTASDGQGGSVSQSFTWTITNPPPLAANDTASTSEDTRVNINVLTNDNDPDGDALRVTLASAGNGTVTILPDGTIDYTPNANFNGIDTITYMINDGNGGTSTATVTVTVAPVNDPPVAVNDAASTNEDTAVTIPLLTNDSDLDGDALTVTSATSPDGDVVINPDGTVTFTPNGNFNGTATITYTISDGNGGTATATAIVIVRPVNDPPVATNDTATTAEDTPATLNVLGNDSDVDGDPLTVTSATSPDGQVTINPDGTITFSPNPNFNGTTTITYTISDGQGGHATATVTLTVTPVNDPPVANPSAATTNEDAAVVLPVLSNDTDVDGNPLTVTAASAANGTVTINPDGTVTYTPNANFNGTDTVTYSISDGQGGTSTSTVTITVNPINDVPVAVNDSATTPEDAPVTIPVLGNDTDADGNPLTVTAATSPNGTVVINPDGTITFTPNPNFNGPTTITYTISDGQGGTATATVSVNVTPVNDSPVARPDTASGTEDTPLVISPLANDSDVDGNPLTIVSASSPNGTVTINPDGSITFTPDPNFNGSTTITYQISDGQGGFSTATISVNVAAVNDPPVAVNDAATTPEDTPVTVPVLTNDSDVDGNPLTVTAASSPNGTVVINPDGTITFTPNPNFNGPATITYTISDGQGGTSTATVAVNVTPVNDTPVATLIAPQTHVDSATVTLPVAGNFSDVDGDTLTFTARGLPPGLSINASTGVISGTIARDASQPNGGVYSVTVIASDGRGSVVSQSFSWTVTNPAPIATNDSATTNEDTPVTIPVLTNDRDPDGDPLTVTAATSPNGTVVINPNGTLTFTPNPNFNGPTTITYSISDGNGGTSTATVTVNVTPVNDPPVAVNDTVTTPIETPVRIPILTNDSDLDGDRLTVVSVSSLDGTVVINPDGTITFTPAANFTGDAIVTYTISDGNGGTATATVRVNVVGATLDMNALLGRSTDQGIDNGWRVDNLRDAEARFIDVPLIVDQTANDVRSLNPTPMLFGERPLLTAINGITSLRGIGELGAHPISEVAGQIDDRRDIRFGADRLFDPRFGDFIVKSLTGFSVRQLNTGSEQVMIESVVRDRVVYVEIRDIGKDSDPRIVEYQLRMRDGGALPDWIRMDNRGLAIIERPVDAQQIRMIIRAIRADGQVIEIPVVVQGATGEIQLDTAITKTLSTAETLSKNMALAANAVTDEAARLAAAFEINEG
jgi:large repetitive protein